MFPQFIPKLPSEWYKDNCTIEYVKNITRYDSIFQQFLKEFSEYKKENLNLAELHIEFKKLLGIYQVKCIKEYANNKKIVAFFCPTAAFRGHYISAPERLRESGVAALFLYGTVCDDRYEKDEGAFFWGAPDQYLDKEKLSFVNIFAVSSIMDCLPKSSIKILYDHISFATFVPDWINEETKNLSYDNLSEPQREAVFKKLYKKHEMLALIPLFDYYLVPSVLRMKYLQKFLFAYGYKSKTEIVDSDGEFASEAKFFKNYLYSGTEKQASNITLIPSGYCKLDSKINKEAEPVDSEENILVYAPTPNDPINKDEWLPHMSINEMGAEIIETLCNNFPNYQIVFKPYVDERKEVVKNIIDKNKHLSNFKYFTDSNYLSLYDKASLMISDFSSTAYTFALSNLKPVVFFSRHEELIANNNSDYLKYREEVGSIATNISELVEKTKYLLDNKKEFHKKIEILRQSNIYNLGKSEEYITEAILVIFNKKDLGNECVKFNLERSE